MTINYTLTLLLLAAIGTISCQTTTPVESGDQVPGNALQSQVFTLDKAQVINEKFGTVNLFTTGTEETYGTKGVVTGTLTLLPQSEAHPPHKHAEEEYLFISKGSGIWSVNGKEFPAKAGDLLYASPWDLHGLFNSDTVALEFYFVKWNNKGIAIPTEP